MAIMKRQIEAYRRSIQKYEMIKRKGEEDLLQINRRYEQYKLLSDREIKDLKK